MPSPTFLIPLFESPHSLKASNAVLRRARETNVLDIVVVKPDPDGHGSWVEIVTDTDANGDDGKPGGSFWTPVDPASIATMYQVADQGRSRVIIKKGRCFWQQRPMSYSRASTLSFIPSTQTAYSRNRKVQ